MDVQKAVTLDLDLISCLQIYALNVFEPKFIFSRAFLKIITPLCLLPSRFSAISHIFDESQVSFFKKKPASRNMFTLMWNHYLLMDSHSITVTEYHSGLLKGSHLCLVGLDHIY